MRQEIGSPSSYARLTSRYKEGSYFKEPQVLLFLYETLTAYIISAKNLVGDALSIIWHIKSNFVLLCIKKKKYIYFIYIVRHALCRWQIFLCVDVISVSVTVSKKRIHPSQQTSGESLRQHTTLMSHLTDVTLHRLRLPTLVSAVPRAACLVSGESLCLVKFTDVACASCTRS